MLLAQLSWPEIPEAVSRVCVVPLGSLEQHGPHLPLWTDTAIVSEIARRIEQRLPAQVVLAPVQPVGYSAHHAKFGCVGLDLEAYVGLIGSVCRSLAGMGLRRIFLLNGHGGNDVPCRAAMCALKTELPGLRVAFASYWTLAAEAFSRIRSSPRGGMGHACEMETSIMLALHPDQVHLERAADDGTAGESGYRLFDMLRPQPYYMVRNFDELSANGTLGCPSHASAPKGERFLDAAVDAACSLVAAFATGELEFGERA
ncbi:MAG: creatininase family protein [Bryobacteraceae bacterium]